MALATLLAACGGAPTVKTAKGGYYLDDGPGDPALVRVADAVPRHEPLHRFANRTYVALGETYEPRLDASGFSQEGMASWYGRRFHGKRTASGEAFDMYDMTAAHPTLPIPSYARVTALDSGRSVVVRVNDRGPFHSTRIIDLSYAAAHKLGITLKGMLRVRVESVLPDEASPPPAVLGSGDYLQIGAFSQADRARKLAARVIKRLRLPEEQVSVREASGVHRVWLGPYRGAGDLDEIAHLLRERMGLEAVRAQSDPNPEEFN